MTDLPFQNHSETSKQAAKSMEDIAPTIRERIFEFLKNRENQGATAEEIELLMNIKGSTVRPRLVELEQSNHIKKKLIDADTPATRPTKSNRAANIYIVKEQK